MLSRPLKKEEIKRYATLLNSELDIKMSPQLLDKLFSFGEMIELSRWDTIISAGEMNADIYIAVEGILRCWFMDDDKEKTAFFSAIPTIIFNYHTYIAGQPSFFNIQACTASKVIHFAREDFDNLLNTNQEFALWNLRLAHDQLYYFELKHKLNSGHAIDRYRSLIKELPNIMQEVPLQVVASYLGVTPQHLSRLRRNI